ncbi:MAG: hypothetical protein SVS85_01510, partial [Candidatus Nanohaloarchaea archaeon]|nr:hypothetical protein [Candidatus Nanohaloarchaea archaeon]
MGRGRKGFMYSMFAILVLGLLVTVVSNPLQIEDPASGSEISRIDETFYFLSSVKNDAERGTRIIAKRAFSSTINYVATHVSPLENPEQEVVSAFLNGTVNGSEQSLMEDASFEDWNQSMVGEAEKSGYDLEIEPVEVQVSASKPSTAFFNATYRVNLSDPRSDARFVQNTTVNEVVNLANMSDPLLFLQTSGRYSRGFSNCAYDRRAFQLSTGGEKFYSNARNWTSGEAVARPGNG